MAELDKRAQLYPAGLKGKEDGRSSLNSFRYYISCNNKICIIFASSKY